MRHLSRKVVLVVTGIATALMLINVTNRTVIDKTGLAGLYDIKLEWAPVLTTAIEEQLGLRLVSTKAPLEVLVIDHVERPSEN